MNRVFLKNYFEVKFFLPLWWNKWQFSEYFPILKISCKPVINDVFVTRNNQKFGGITITVFFFVIEVLPYNAYCHDEGFAGACCHFKGVKRILIIRRVIRLYSSCSEIPCHVYKVAFFHHFINVNQCFNRFPLAEPELKRLTIYNMVFTKPELQQAAGGVGCLGIALFSPGENCLAKLID